MYTYVLKQACRLTTGWEVVFPDWRTILRGVCSAFVWRHAPHIVVVASAQRGEAACFFHITLSFAHDMHNYKHRQVCTAL